MSNSISKFYKSFSGTDTIAFLMFPGISPITIGSLSTISYSMFRNKVPVINIGRTNINGITRGSRIYAGTMVFTLINKHWIRELQSKAEYLANFPTLKTDELPLFDIMILSANEYGSACSMFIYGIDFTDESQTLSVEDLFTENVFKFVAREVSVFDSEIVNTSDNDKKFYTISSGTIENYVENYKYETSDSVRDLTRDLYYVSNGPLMIGEDVAGIQQLLNNVLQSNNRLEINYTFDKNTDAAVKEFQKLNNLRPDGIVDGNVYSKLLERFYMNDSEDNMFVQVVNKAGAYIYEEPNTSSNINNLIPYLDSIEITSNELINESFYQTRDGYVSYYDTYDYLNNNNSYTFEELKFGDDGPQVTIAQNILEELYPTIFNNYKIGKYDEITERFVEIFQRKNDLNVTGIIDPITWNYLIESSDNNYTSKVAGYSDISYPKLPGVYTISNNIEDFSEYTSTLKVNSDEQVKVSIITVDYDNNTKTYSEVLLVTDVATYNFEDYIDKFNINLNRITDLYFIIYPYGSIASKWHFNIREA